MARGVEERLVQARRGDLDIRICLVVHGALEQTGNLGRRPQIRLVQEIRGGHRARIHARLGAHHVGKRRQIVTLRRIEQRMGKTVRHERLGIQVDAGFAVEDDNVRHLRLGKRVVQAKLIELGTIVVSQREVLLSHGGGVLGVRALLDERKELLGKGAGIGSRRGERTLDPAIGCGQLAITRAASQVGKSLIGRDQPVVASVDPSDLFRGSSRLRIFSNSRNVSRGRSTSRSGRTSRSGHARRSDPALLPHRNGRIGRRHLFGCPHFNLIAHA